MTTAKRSRINTSGGADLVLAYVIPDNSGAGPAVLVNGQCMASWTVSSPTTRFPPDRTERCCLVVGHLGRHAYAAGGFVVELPDVE